MSEMVYYTDYEKLKTGRKKVSLTPSAFKMGGIAYWKNLIADQDVEVEKNTISLVKIRPLSLPPNTLASPLAIMRHPLGVSLDVYLSKPARIEETKKIVATAFFSVEDGVIESGDLIGVVKVFPVSVSATSSIPTPQVAMTLETSEAKLVYRSNGEIIRERAEIPEYWYRRWNVGEWYPLIADENVEVRKGRSVFVRVRDVELPPNTIPVPLYMMRHALGVCIDVFQPGRHRRVEERRHVNRALFMPVFDGVIEEGDIIGVLNVYYVSTGEMAHKIVQSLTSPVISGKVVYWRREGELCRKEVEMEPFMFRRSSIGRFEPLVSAERCEMKANEVQVIDVEPLEFPSGTIVQPLSGRNHAYGILIDVFDFSPVKMVEEDRKITKAVFLPFRDCKIEKGEMIGSLAIYHISPLLEPGFFLAKHRLV